MSRRTGDRQLNKQARRSSRWYSLWRNNIMASQSNRTQAAGKVSGQQTKVRI